MAAKEWARKIAEIERDPDLLIVEGETDGGVLKLVINVRTKEIVETLEWEPPEDWINLDDYYDSQDWQGEMEVDYGRGRY